MTVAISLSLLVGCGKYNEEEIALRDKGVELMDAGDYVSILDSVLKI